MKGKQIRKEIYTMADKEKKVRELIDDGKLDQVAGGYSRENWEQMTTQERIDAYNDSKAKRKQDGNAYCAFYDPDA